MPTVALANMSVVGAGKVVESISSHPQGAVDPLPCPTSFGQKKSPTHLPTPSHYTTHYLYVVFLTFAAENSSLFT